MQGTEQIEEPTGTHETATAVEDSSYSKILEGEGSDASKPDSSVNPQETNPEVNQAPEDVILEIGGKEYTVKQAELLEYLTNSSKFADREKSLVEKEKSLNRDYTQKSQQNAEFRKSLETAFGYMPQQQEIQAMGKLVKAYHTSPQVKQTIDSILSGRPISTQPTEQVPQSQLEGELRDEIQALKEQLGTFTNSFQERDRAEKEKQAKATWDGWVAKQAEKGVKVTDEIDAKMTPFIVALKEAHPDKDNQWILDTAYKHATIDDIEKNTAGKVLKAADKAKISNLPKITPKSSAKPDSEKSYAEILLEGGR